MSDDGWNRLFVTDGTLRAPWRLLLFGLLFGAFLTAGALAVTAFAGQQPPRTSELGRLALLWQGIPLAAALCAGWIMLALVDRRPPGALGFAWTSHTPRELGIGFAIGAGSLAVLVALFALAGWLEYRPDGGTVGTFATVLVVDLVVLAVAAAFEEAFFRGYPFQVLAQALGPVVATLAMSAAFAVAHGRNPDATTFALINIFLAGVLLSVAYLRTRSLWYATTVHLGWNWAMASLFDLPVSGLAFLDTPLYEPVETGPAWITGGSFGPEGGIGAALAFGLALVAVLWAPGLDEAPEMRARRPLVDR